MLPKNKQPFYGFLEYYKNIIEKPSRNGKPRKLIALKLASLRIKGVSLEQARSILNSFHPVIKQDLIEKYKIVDAEQSQIPDFNANSSIPGYQNQMPVGLGWCDRMPVNIRDYQNQIYNIPGIGLQLLETSRRKHEFLARVDQEAESLGFSRRQLHAILDQVPSGLLRSQYLERCAAWHRAKMTQEAARLGISRRKLVKICGLEPFFSSFD